MRKPEEGARLARSRSGGGQCVVEVERRERRAHSVAGSEAVQGGIDPCAGSAFTFGKVGTIGVLSRGVV